MELGMLSEEARAEIEARLEPGLETEVDDSSTEEFSSEEAQQESAALSENDGGEDVSSSHEESVPYERFRAINESNRELKERLEALEARLEEGAGEPEDLYEPDDSDRDPIDHIEDRLSRMELRYAEQLLSAELKSVRTEFPVFENEKAEGVLLDLIAANPKRSVRTVASDLAGLLSVGSGSGESAGGPSRSAPETPDRPTASGVSKAPAKQRKAPSSIEEGTAMLRKAMESGLIRLG